VLSPSSDTGLVTRDGLCLAEGPLVAEAGSVRYGAPLTSDREVAMLSLLYGPCEEYEEVRSEFAYSGRFLSSDLCGREGPSGAVFGGAYDEGEFAVYPPTGVVGREPGRAICKGRVVDVPGAEEGCAGVYAIPLVTEGERRRVGNGGARDMGCRWRVVVSRL